MKVIAILVSMTLASCVQYGQKKPEFRLQDGEPYPNGFTFEQLWKQYGY